MIVRIDSAGRIVVPKAVRDRLGLRPNVEIELIEQSGGALLKALTETTTFVEIDGVLVHCGRPEKGANWDNLIEDIRNERADSMIPRI